MKIMKKNIKTFNKHALPVALMFVVVSAVLAPALISTANAATFNQGSQPWNTLRAYNYTDNGSCSTCWQDDNINVSAGDIVTVRIFYQNTSEELAEDTRVRISPSVSYDGETAEITGRIWADNAGTITDTVTIKISSNQEIASLSHTGDTFWYDGFFNQKSLLYGQDKSDVVDPSGLRVGNVVPGLENSGFVVARFKVNGGEVEAGDNPDVVTISATNIKDDEARLRGEVDPNNLDTKVWFQWSTNKYNLNEDNSAQTIDWSVSSADFDFVIDNLEEDTLYYFRAVAKNDEGTDRGNILSFRTDSGPSDDPEILDIDVDNIDEDSARLICEVDPNGEDTDVWFEWDENKYDVEDGRGEETRTIEVNRNETRQEVRITITGLDKDTRYFFKCLAENSDGDDESNIDDFRTDEDGGRSGDEPDVTTRSATDIQIFSAVLRGEVDPNGEDTDVWFEYGTSRSNLNRDTGTEDVGDGTREEDFDERITGLNGNTTYYFRAVAESREGIDRGSILSFTTVRGTITPPPTIITRIVEVIREVEPEPEGLIITLNRDGTDINNGEIGYKVSYDNRTDETFTNAELVVELPDELEFINADPTEDSERRGVITFSIGTIRPSDEDSFMIETEIARGVDDRDEIIFVANVEYTDSGTKKIVTVIDSTTLEEARRGGGFGAFLGGSFGDFITNPFLWFLIFLAVVFFVYRYFASLTRLQTEGVTSDGVIQQQLPQ